MQKEYLVRSQMFQKLPLPETLQNSLDVELYPKATSRLNQSAKGGFEQTYRGNVWLLKHLAERLTADYSKTG
jgi:hypothetical protein